MLSGKMETDFVIDGWVDGIKVSKFTHKFIFFSAGMERTRVFTIIKETSVTSSQ